LLLARRQLITKAGSMLTFIALGSNLGNSAEILHAAMDRLQALTSEPVLRSSLWRTSPVDCPPDSPGFLNAVAGLVPHPDETAESLLSKLQGLEKAFGRVPKKVLNEPRPLDLDLIDFGAEQRHSPSLTLPHPRAHLRRFVLQPLREIAPDLVLPGQTKPVSQLLLELPPGESVVASGIPA
jgi:2-amino-4-hydroxy-6-hydroxymethyldihydropteridine diphosphokinase